ncbi:hypothetical protein D3C86_1434840 [compost metagenome]
MDKSACEFCSGFHPSASSATKPLPLVPSKAQAWQNHVLHKGYDTPSPPDFRRVSFGSPSGRPWDGLRTWAETIAVRRSCSRISSIRANLGPNLPMWQPPVTTGIPLPPARLAGYKLHPIVLL